MASTTTISVMDLSGGAACLDFVNSGLDYGDPVERVHSYNDLLILAGRTGTLTKPVISALKSLAGQHPERAEQVVTKARRSRAAMTAIFRSLVKGGTRDIADEATLSLFNRDIHDALSKKTFVMKKGQWINEWANPNADLLIPLHAFVFSAWEVLNTKDQGLIKLCGNCDWMFLDETKNHRKKWCDMKSCGNNVKAKRYYERHKQND